MKIMISSVIRVYIVILIALVFSFALNTNSSSVYAQTCMDNAISYLRFSEGTGILTSDEVSPRTLQIDGNASWTTGKVGSGVAFNGIAQGLAIADHTDFDWSASHEFTIELWCRTTGSKDELQVIIGRETSGSTHWWIGMTTDKKAAFYLYDESGAGGGILGLDSIDDGSWHHIAAVHIGSQKRNLLYIDGKINADSIFDYTSSFNSDANINIGNFYTSGQNRYFFQGELDELAVSNRAVSENEIYGHYIKGFYSVDYCGDLSISPHILTEPDTLVMINQPYSYEIIADGYPTPVYSLLESPAGMSINPVTGQLAWIPETAGRYTIVASATNSAGSALQDFKINVLEPCMEELISYLRFNEGDGQVSLDEANLQLLQIEGNASWGPGKVGSGLSFDGITQGISMTAHPDFNWTQDQDFSLEVWFKTNSSTEDLQVIMGRDTPDKTHWWVGLNAAKQAVFYLYDESRNGGGVAGTEALDDNAWHYLTIVYQGAMGNISLYVDGELNSESTYSYAADFTSASEIQIANLYYNNSYNFYFEGQIDEIATSNRALPEQEILEHYLKGSNNVGYCENLILMPSITSEPITEAYSYNSYTYLVEATGLPSPEFELNNPPEGMSINSISGLIDWVPNGDGDFEVEIVAINSGGEDNQIFTIHVIDACVEEGISYFNFEESDGMIVQDLLSDREGQLLNNPVRQEALIGNSILFNGLDQSIVIADHDDFDFPPGSSFSFELWCNPGTSNTNLQVFMGRNETGGIQWWMGLQQDSKLPAVYLFDENRLGGGLTGTQSIGDGKWHHLVAVYNHIDNLLLLYIDGSLNAQMDAEFTSGFSSESVIQIACLFVDDTFQYFYEGELDEIVIYDRALTSNEIILHHELGSLGHGYCFSARLDIESQNKEADALKYSIYPIPAQDKLNIDFESSINNEISIQLINTLGVICYEKSVMASDNLELDISESAKGFYVLRITSREKILIQEGVVIQ